MPKEIVYYCDSENCGAKINGNSFTAYHNSSGDIGIFRGIKDEHKLDYKFFCSEACLIKHISKLIREMK